MTTPAKRIFSHDGFDSFSPCPALNILKEAVKKKDEYLMVRGRLTKREGTQKCWMRGGKHIIQPEKQFKVCNICIFEEIDSFY